LPLAVNRHLPIDMPLIASNQIWRSYYQRAFPDIRKINVSDTFPLDNTTCPDFEAKKLRQAYRAAVSFTDRNIGMVLGKLRELGLYDSTIICFISDHGYQLGDNDQWGKHTNFEHATHVPAMLRLPPAFYPGFKPGRSAAFVEEVDLFPTLVEVAIGNQLPRCPENLPAARQIDTCTEGLSFAPLLMNGSHPWKQASFSQYQRGANMGYTVRVDGWRYTEWAAFNRSRAATGPDWTKLQGVELYAHGATGANDCTYNYEHRNVVKDAANKAVSERLRKLLHSGWRQALPGAALHQASLVMPTGWMDKNSAYV